MIATIIDPTAKIIEAYKTYFPVFSILLSPINLLKKLIIFPTYQFHFFLHIFCLLQTQDDFSDLWQIDNH